MNFRVLEMLFWKKGKNHIVGMHRAAVTLSGQTYFLLGQDLFLAGQIEKIVTLAIVNPDCTVNFFLT